jgi:hypothetical protein
MKMTTEQYEALKADVDAVALHCRLLRRGDTSLAVMWAILHEINAQRSYSDEHPRWKVRERFLTATHVNKKHWLTDLYDAGLNDVHIKTALMKIVTEWGRIPKVENSH